MFSTGVRTKMMDIIWNTSYTLLIPNYKEKNAALTFFGEQNRGEISYFLVSVRVAVGRKMSTSIIFGDLSTDCHKPEPSQMHTFPKN